MTDLLPLNSPLSLSPPSAGSARAAGPQGGGGVLGIFVSPCARLSMDVDCLIEQTFPSADPLALLLSLESSWAQAPEHEAWSTFVVQCFKFMGSLLQSPLPPALGAEQAAACKATLQECAVLLEKLYATPTVRRDVKQGSDPLQRAANEMIEAYKAQYPSPYPMVDIQMRYNGSIKGAEAPIETPDIVLRTLETEGVHLQNLVDDADDGDEQSKLLAPCVTWVAEAAFHAPQYPETRRKLREFLGLPGFTLNMLPSNMSDLH